MIGTSAYSGGVFSGSIDGGRAGAEIELSDAGIFARTNDGQTFLLPYDQCQIEIGGFSGKMIFCRNPDRSITIFSEDRNFKEALARASSGLLAQQIDQQHGQQRSRGRRSLWLGTLLLVSIVVLFVGGIWAIRAAAQSMVHVLPVSVDQKLGELAFNTMDRGGPELHEPEVIKALQSIVDRMAPHAGMDNVKFRVHVIKSPVVNAFALPGGIIVVFTGLIERADDAQQVAGVLGHEMAHVTLRHGLERVADSANLLIAIELLLGDATGLIGLGAELFTVASVNSYSRQQELAADAAGVQLLYDAGIDPAGLADFLQMLDEDEGEGPVPGAIAWMSTHPQNKKRIAAIQQLRDSLPQRAFQPLAVDWQQVQADVAQ